GLLEGTSNSITLGITRDTRDVPLDPTTGSVVSLTSDFFGGPLGGDFDAIKVTGEYKRYWRMAPMPPPQSATATAVKSRPVIAFRFLAGGAHGGLSLLDRFELGGSTSVRGVEFDAQDGDKSVLTNLEYRFPLITNLTGAVFFDAGTAAQPGESLDFDNVLT